MDVPVGSSALSPSAFSPLPLSSPGPFGASVVLKPQLCVSLQCRVTVLDSCKLYELLCRD